MLTLLIFLSSLLLQLAAADDNALPKQPTKADRCILITAYTASLRDGLIAELQTLYENTYGIPLEIESPHLGSIKDSMQKGEELLRRHKVLAHIYLGGGESLYRHNSALFEQLPQVGDPRNSTAAEQLAAKMDQLQRQPRLQLPLVSDEKNYFGASLSVMVILYNDRLREQIGLPVPKTIYDITTPSYYNQCIIAHFEHSSVAFTIVKIFLNEKGWHDGYNHLIRLICNSVEIKNGTSATVDAIEKQNGIGCPTIAFYGASATQQNPDLRIKVLPQQSSIDPVAISKGLNPAQKEIAERVVALILSPPYQRFLLQEMKRIPVDIGVLEASSSPEEFADKVKLYSQPQADPYHREIADSMPDRWESKHTRAISTILSTCLISKYQEIKLLWERAHALPEGSQKIKTEVIEALTTPPFSKEILEKEYLGLPSQAWSGGYELEEIIVKIQEIISKKHHHLKKLLDTEEKRLLAEKNL